MMNKLSTLTFYHFNELHSKGYTLDILFMLILASQEEDVESLCKHSPKLEMLYQGIVRKGLINKNNTLSLSGKALLDILDSEGEMILVKKVVKKEEDFDLWWRTFPGTDTFTYKNQSFTGTRSLRAKKDECKVKIGKILGEGEYTISELISALEYEIIQKKENSIKTKTNKLSYMQNTLTYLNQRTFEPFIELIREGHKITESLSISGGTDI